MYIVDWLKVQPVTCWYLLHLTGICYQLRASFSVAVVGCAKTNRGFFVTKYYKYTTHKKCPNSINIDAETKMGLFTIVLLYNYVDGTRRGVQMAVGGVRVLAFGPAVLV